MSTRTVRLLARQGTTAEWASADAQTLSVGEIGFDTDTGLLRIGDGATSFLSLKPVNSPTGISHSAPDRPTMVTQVKAGLFDHLPDGELVQFTVGNVVCVVRKKAGATSITGIHTDIDLPDFEPSGMIFPEIWGAANVNASSSADSSTVCDAAVEKALAYSKVVYLGAGYYRCTTPVLAIARRRIYGLGQRVSFLHADHLAGEAIRFYGDENALQGVGVTSSTRRKAGKISFNPATALNTATDTITLGAHQFVADDLVLYTHGGGTEMGGSTHATRYYIVNPTATTVQISETEGGSPINLTSVGAGTTHWLRKVNQFGILIEGPDLPEGDDDEQTAINSTFDDFYVEGHPDDGIHVIGPAFTGKITNFRFSLIGGHGVYMDRGEKKGRVNLVEQKISGVCVIGHGRFGNIDGHLIALGSPNGTYAASAFPTPVLRVEIDNCEGGGNSCTQPGVYYTESTCYIRGANHELNLCGFSGSKKALAYIAGRNIHLRNDRHLGSEGPNFYIIGSFDNASTQNIFIHGMSPINPDTDLNPAILFDLPSGQTIPPNSIYVWHGERGDITNMFGVTGGLTDLNDIKRLYFNGLMRPLRPLAAQVVNNDASPTQILACDFPMFSSEEVEFEFTLEATADAAADVRVDFIAPSGATIRYGVPNSLKVGVGDTAVVQGVVTGPGDLQFGGAGTARLYTIRGYCKTNGNAGDLVPRVAQVNVDASDVTVVPGLTSFRIREIA